MTIGDSPSKPEVTTLRRLGRHERPERISAYAPLDPRIVTCIEVGRDGATVRGRFHTTRFGWDQVRDAVVERREATAEKPMKEASGT